MTREIVSSIQQTRSNNSLQPHARIEAWQLELFEASGDRVWMYASNAELLPNDSLAVREDAGLPRRAGMLKRMLYWMASIRY